MDASCKIQGSIHVFRLVNNMCPGKWVHITARAFCYRLAIPIRQCDRNRMQVNGKLYTKRK